MQTLKPKGFTLIELMITVVIIGILTALAYPAYTKYMQQTRRSDAQIALTDAASRMEKYYSDCTYYTQNLGGAHICGTDPTTGALGYTTTSPKGYYTLAPSGGFIGATASQCTSYTCGFTITATATGAQAGNGNLRIDSTGNKQWDKNNNGTYSASWTDK